jgi:hypothetical protein
MMTKHLYNAIFFFAILLSSSPSGQAQAGNCPSDMTHYWMLDETSGTSYGDSYAGNNATCSANCPTPTTGQVYGAQQFTSATQLNAAGDNTFNWGVSDSFSVEFWMKTDPASTCSGNQVIVGRADKVTQLQWWVGCWNGGKGAFVLKDKNGNLAILNNNNPVAADLTDGKWHHIVAVRNGSSNQMSIYVDGVLEDFKTPSFSTGFDSTAAINMGWLDLSAGYHFAGAIDEVAIYNRALSDVEIQSHYYLTGGTRGYCDMCSVPVKIMPVGDSITQGDNSAISDDGNKSSYRQQLYLDLINSGYYIDLVGSLQDGYLLTPPFDTDNEGHPGWTASCDLSQYGYGQVVNDIYGWLTKNPPDIILLHIGTNDVANSCADPSGVASILDKIDSFNKNITVLLARIINFETPSQAVTDFNNAVQAIAQARIANGDKIIMVDEENALTYPSDMDTYLHPTQTGYDKMAGPWFSALRNFLPICGQSAPVITSTPVTSASVGQSYMYDVNATGNPMPTYSLTTFPTGMTIDAATGVISWTPSATGNYSVMVQASNGVGTSATQSFTINVVDKVKIWIEAEAGSLNAPMQVAADTQASSGRYILVPNGAGNITDPSQAGGYAQYTFNVPTGGSYVIWGRASAASTLDDSFFVKVDNGAYALWDVQFGTWVWDMVNNRGVADPVIYSLGAGTHTLIVKQREDGAKIDRILITNDMGYVPQGTGELQQASAALLTPVVSDTQSPTVPADLSATAASSSQINVSWKASTDNVGVAGYRIYRNGGLIATTPSTSYSNTGLSSSTSYSYTIAAYDAAGNVSPMSASASATTLATLKKWKWQLLQQSRVK